MYTVIMPCIYVSSEMLVINMMLVGLGGCVEKVKDTIRNTERKTNNIYIQPYRRISLFVKKSCYCML